MDSKTLYTPIAKGKENDFKAIGKMPNVLSARMFPLVELIAPDDPKDFDASYIRFAGQLRKHCPHQRLSVDLHSIAPGQRTLDGSWGLEAVCSYLNGLGIEFVPVYGFDHEPELWDRIVRISRRMQRGLTFRLTQDDLLAPEDALDELLDRLASARIPTREVNLVLDLASLEGLAGSQIARIRSQAYGFVDMATTAREFNLLSIVGSSMPKDVTNIPKEGRAAIQRRELPLWIDIANRVPGVPIAYGDYGTVHPNFSLKAPATNANAKIRYTHSREHHIFRGYRLLDGLKYGQYHGLAHQVISDPIYMGQDYSYGDDYLWRCANRDAGTGNLGTWVEVDLNHHLVFTAAQLTRIESRVASGMSIDDFEAMVA